MHPRAKAAYIAQLVEGNRRSARPYACRKCGLACLQGDDADNVSCRVTVETDLLTLTEEMFHVLAGRRTYDLVPRAGSTGDLYLREDWHIHGRRPDRYPILVEHHC